jgi:hypothetical protein
MELAMTSTIYLFPDTNLFVQCKSLRELDWSTWAEFDEVHLIVSRPVQAEIDNQKGKGSSRLAKRARTASSMFRGILLSDTKYLEVRAGKPVVRVYLRQDLKWNPSLAEQLSYEERDDQLVGIASLFAENHRDSDVRLLTHDTGPMTSAQMVGLKFEPIPDEWMLAPEPDEKGKRINELQEEVARLNKAEPAFEATVKNHGTDDAALDFDFHFYSALDENQVQELVAYLTAAFPISNDFGSRVPDERTIDTLFNIRLGREIYTPVTDEEIDEYRVALYPEWVAECTKVFRELHATLNERMEPPRLTVWAKNIGGRPADSALVTFTAAGNFKIFAPSKDDDKEPAPIGLPSPPTPPEGQWEWSNAKAWKNIADLSKIAAPYLRGADMDYVRSLTRPSFDVSSDPNAFYYKPTRPGLPTDEISLRCTQWRHQGEKEPFHFDIHVQHSPGQVSGALKVRIEAANKTEPFIQTAPVRVNVSEVTPLNEAYGLVSALAEKNR